MAQTRVCIKLYIPADLINISLPYRIARQHNLSFRECRREVPGELRAHVVEIGGLTEDVRDVFVAAASIGIDVQVLRVMEGVVLPYRVNTLAEQNRPPRDLHPAYLKQASKTFRQTAAHG